MDLDKLVNKFIFCFSERENYDTYSSSVTGNFGGVVPSTYAILDGTTATKRGIRRAYRTALPQYLTGRARALIGL